MKYCIIIRYYLFPKVNIIQICTINFQAKQRFNFNVNRNSIQRDYSIKLKTIKIEKNIPE